VFSTGEHISTKRNLVRSFDDISDHAVEVVKSDFLSLRSRGVRYRASRGAILHSTVIQASVSLGIPEG
jgi:hypothetical protein